MKKLFSKNNPPTQKAGKKAAHKHTGISLIRMSLVLVVVVPLVMLLTGLLAYLQYSKVVSEREQDNRNAEIQRMAAQLTGRMAALGDEIGRLAIADDTLLNAIERVDRFVLNVLEQRIHARYPEALRVRYILPTDKQPEETVDWGLGYASLELARIAERGQHPPIEMHRPTTEQRYLAVVHPIHAQERTVASLLMMLNPALLSQWMTELKVTNGLVELSQGDGLQLGSVGNRQLRTGSGYQADITGTSWRLTYWPAATSNADDNVTSSLQFIAVFMVAALVLMGMLLFYGLFISRLVRTDMGRMVKFIIDSGLGKRFHSYPVKLSESKKVLQDKETDLAVLSSSARAQGSFKGVTDAEIPDMLFDEGDGIVIDEENNK